MEYHRNQFRIALMAHVLDVSRSGYYAWRKRGKSVRQISNDFLLVKIKATFKAFRGTYGSPRITAELKGQDVACGENRVARLMKANRIAVEQIQGGSR